MSKFPGWSRFPGLKIQVRSALRTALRLETFFSLDFVTLWLWCFSQTEACRPPSQRCAPARLCCRPDVERRWMWWLPERETELVNSPVTVSVCDGPEDSRDTHSRVGTSLWPTPPLALTDAKSQLLSSLISSASFSPCWTRMVPLRSTGSFSLCLAWIFRPNKLTSKRNS